jgi:hypothetical protein
MRRATWNASGGVGVLRDMPSVALFLLGLTTSGELIEPTACLATRGQGLCREAPVSRGFINGARAAVDPLGRGVWVVDDENDEVLLISRPAPHTSAGSVQRFRVGAWPEQVLPTPGGRTFVTARQAGVVAVIEPDGTTWSIPLGTEPKVMALDLTTNRLFVGLVTALEVASLDAETGAVLRRRAMTMPPDFLALSPAGLLVASRRSDVVEALDLDLQSRASINSAIAVSRARTRIIMTLGITGTRDLRRIRGLGDQGLGPAEHRVVGLTTVEDRLSLLVEEVLPRTAQGESGYGGSDVPIQHVLLEGALTPIGLLDEHVTLLEPSPVADLLPLGGGTIAALEGREMVFVSGRSKGAIAPWSPLRSMVLEGTPQSLAVDDDRSLIVVSRNTRTVAWYRTALVDQPRSRHAPDARVTVPLPPSAIEPTLRRGRELFFSLDDAVTTVGMTCATCHPDGREDGRVWAQENTLRQTPMLTERLRGTAPYNWHGTRGTLEANVKQTIQERLLGEGLGRADLKALSRYLVEGLRPVQKRVTSTGTLVDQGRALFHDEEVGCAGCHDSATQFTDGRNHDVHSLRGHEVAFARESSVGVRFSFRGTGPASPNAARKLSAQFNTPSLTQVVLTPPYMHDGSVPTLHALIEENHDRMGATSQLSAHERRALVAYLETL